MATSKKSEHKDDDTDLDPEIGGRNLSSKCDYSASTSNSSVEDVRLSTRDTNSKVLGDHRRPSIAIQMPSSDNPLEQDGSDDEDDSPKAATPLTMSYGRSKARLQEPPLMTLGMQEQIAQSLQRRRYSESAIMEDEEGLTPLLEETSPGKPATSEKQAPLPASKRRSLIGAPSIKNALRSVSKSFSIPAQNVEEEDPLENDVVPENGDKKKENIGWMVIQWVSLILLAALLGCSIRIKEVRDIQWQDEQIWRWQALALVIFSGQLISGWIVQGLVLLFENHFFLKKRVLYFVYGLRKSVKRSIWLGLVIVVWQEIFAKRASTKIVRTITKVLWCLFTICTSWMLKVLAVKIAANSFHRAAYFDRIQDCLFNQYILERLSAPAQVVESAKLSSSISMAPTASPKNPAIPMFKQTMTQRRHSTALDTASLQELHQGIPSSLGKQHAKPMMAKSASPIEQDKLQQLTSETVSAWTLKSLMKTVRKTNMSTKSSFLSEVHGDGEIDSEARAKAAAKQIFYNVARPGQKYLTLADFLYFLPEEKATRAFSLFETTEHGTITKKALVKWVVNVYKERRALALTLNDNKTVVAKLHKVLDVVLCLFLFIVCLLIMGIETSKLLLFFSSLFIPCVFVFGNSAKTTFDALIFLFVMHPFDVGDRVSVEGSMMLVEEMNVLNTVFLGGTNEKIYYPNSILAMKSITNYYRSPDQWDGIEFQIHMHTPLEKLGHVKERMQKYIESQPQFWYPDFSLVCKDIDDSTRMKMGLYFQHRLTYQEAGERFKRRSNMLLYLKQQLEDLEIGYHLPRQEVLVTGLPVIDMAHAISSIKSVD